MLIGYQHRYLHMHPFPHWLEPGIHSRAQLSRIRQKSEVPMEPRGIAFRSAWLAVDMTLIHLSAMCIASPSCSFARRIAHCYAYIQKKEVKLVYRLIELIVTVPVKRIQEKTIVIIRLLPQTPMALSVFLQNNLRSKE